VRTSQKNLAGADRRLLVFSFLVLDFFAFFNGELRPSSRGEICSRREAGNTDFASSISQPRTFAAWRTTPAKAVRRPNCMAMRALRLMAISPMSTTPIAVRLKTSRRRVGVLYTTAKRHPGCPAGCRRVSDLNRTLIRDASKLPPIKSTLDYARAIHLV